MEYDSYEEFLALVAEFRLEHRNLTDDELDKLVKKTFKIDQATLREMDGVSDLMQFGRE
jgi:hypothetical protein